MIIIEGQNGTGKTTLANRLAQGLKLRYVKDDRRSRLNISGVQHYVERLTETRDYNMVCDRFHLGELVYPGIKKGGRVNMETWQQHMIERMLNNIGAIMVICTAPQRFIKRVYNSRGEDFITYEQSKNEREAFRAATKNSIMNRIFIYNPTRPDIELERLYWVIRSAWHNSEFEKDMRRYSSSGHPNENAIMLVGDKPGRERPPSRFAFCWYNGSSAYLNSALFLTGYAANIYLTNALKHEDYFQNQIDLQHEYTRLKPVAVVALGATAHAALDEAGIKHGYIQHPQWWNRFHHRKLAAYASGIKREIIGQLKEYAHG